MFHRAEMFWGKDHSIKRQNRLSKCLRLADAKFKLLDINISSYSWLSVTASLIERSEPNEMWYGRDPWPELRKYFSTTCMAFYCKMASK